MSSIQGIVMALNCYRGVSPVPTFTALPPPSSDHKIVIEPETAAIRPHVVCAILRGIEFTEKTFLDFIDLQDKLHHNACRRRTLVAIGTHDLDSMKFPLRYTAQAPQDIVFRALQQEREMDATALFEHYENTNHSLRHYLPIIRDAPKYPVIRDADGHVLSLPPIVNGERTKCLTATRNVLIECTAMDLTRAKLVLNVMVTSFAQYCRSIEQVTVVRADGEQYCTPDLSARRMATSMEYIQKSIGVPLMPEVVVQHCQQMMLGASVRAGTEDSPIFDIDVPPMRSDVMSECDVMEDVAIAYGFDRIPQEVAQLHTTGQFHAANEISERAREELAMSGFTEISTFVLCNHRECNEMLNRPVDPRTAVITNPRNIDCEVCRTTMIPSALKTLASNISHPKPIKLYEISDVVHLDSESDTGARNVRRLVALNCDNQAAFEVGHGMLCTVMDRFGVRFDPAHPNTPGTFHLAFPQQPDGAFLPKQQAQVMHAGKCIGEIGVVHPSVLHAFQVTFPCTVFELDMEPLYALLQQSLSKKE
eukprot:gnl/Trimastix_PCT/621.p1 GENE.gnl/Trimastix_PCT/621~~gnl/Trimastix_PCT/621.p1  ORF type:complete len:534 (+),score=216.74 gnl/Trimastix_PCT/621:311-1912(+)